MTHVPVLTKQVLRYLNPKPNENFIDGTVGQAGHAMLMLEKTKPDGRVLGIDLDANQIENSKILTADQKQRIVLVNDSYVNIADIVERVNFRPVNGILLDLGYSSWQLEYSGRGFSFKNNEVLDMRYQLQNVLTAEKIINEYPKDIIEKIITEYGQEKFARQITNKITEQRKIKRIQSTFELVGIIEKAVPLKFRHGKIHVATRTFQAIRIAVNRELDNVKTFLPKALEVLSKGGRLVVLSFHSLEDRIVKNFFKEKSKEGIVKILTPKPIRGDLSEISKNPRARSAKLRAIIKI